jgi:hypothetical protein
MERMRFTCSDKIEMSWIELANYRLDRQAKGRQLRSIGRLSLCKGEGEREGYDLLRQMTPVPLTSVLSPSKGRGGGTCNMNQVRMDLTT